MVSGFCKVADTQYHHALNTGSSQDRNGMHISKPRPSEVPHNYYKCNVFIGFPSFINDHRHTGRGCGKMALWSKDILSHQRCRMGNDTERGFPKKIRECVVNTEVSVPNCKKSCYCKHQPLQIRDREAIGKISFLKTSSCWAETVCPAVRKKLQGEHADTYRSTLFAWL